VADSVSSFRRLPTQSCKSFAPNRASVLHPEIIGQVQWLTLEHTTTKRRAGLVLSKPTWQEVAEEEFWEHVPQETASGPTTRNQRLRYQTTVPIGVKPLQSAVNLHLVYILGVRLRLLRQQPAQRKDHSRTLPLGHFSPSLTSKPN